MLSAGASIHLFARTVYVTSSSVMVTVSLVERSTVNGPTDLDASFDFGPETNASAFFADMLEAGL